MPKVLIIEASDKIAGLLSQFLQKKGMETDVASDGMNALRVFAGGAYDLLLVDVQLPLLNGEELCKRIRTTAKGKGLPLIMMSMTAQDPSDIERLKQELRLSGFLTKPFSPAALDSLVASSLQVRAEKTETTTPPQQIKKGQPSLQGDLGKSPFEKILLYLMVKKGTGILTLTSEQGTRRFFFISGAPVELEQPSEGDSFGGYLQKKKLIEEVELREYAERRNATEEDPRDLLSRWGACLRNSFSKKTATMCTID